MPTDDLTPAVMTDAEVICGWMQPKPALRQTEGEWELAICATSLGWWLLTTTGYERGDEPIIVPADLTLDRLREVEARLTEEQWVHYGILMENRPVGMRLSKALLHASADQKIKALAAVLRGAK